jgi:hypothetical protein
VSDHFLNYPYRRFSSDVYSAQLCELLDANEIPFEVVAEPEGVGSVFLGQATMPGVIVMVSADDVKRIKSLEKEHTPQKHAEPKEPETEDKVEGYWFVIGYIMALCTAPIAIIIGLHLWTAKRRKRNFESIYAYDGRARFHGRTIFWFSLFFFIANLIRAVSDGKSDFLDTMSFAAWAITEAFYHH